MVASPRLGAEKPAAEVVVVTRLLVAALTWLSSHITPDLHVGRGTVFNHSHIDRHNPPGRFACDFPRRRASQSPASRRLESRGQIVAHRTLPCWSVLTVCSVASLRCSEATVGDRGPVRAAIDLLQPLADLLRHDGELVLFWPHREVAPAPNS